MRGEPSYEPAAVLSPPALRVTVAPRPGVAGADLQLAPHRGWTVGRAAGADVVVDDTQVSRRHLVLEPLGDGWSVRDVSSNGTWSAGRRVPPPGLVVPAGGRAELTLGAPTGPALTLRCAAPERHGGPPPVLPPPGVGAPAPGAAPVRRRRRGRRAAVVVGVLVILLVAADRVAAVAAGTAAVSQIVQQSQGLTSKPSVSFGGFPFLTQVATGSYSDVHVQLGDISAKDAPHIDRIAADLHGAHLPLSSIVGGDVRQVPVDRIDASVELSFADLNAYLAGQTGGLVLTSAGDGAISIAGKVDLDGTAVSIKGSAKLGVADGGLVVTPVDVQVGGGDDPLGGLAGGIASLLPPIPVPLGGLPFDLRLTSVKVTGDGISAAAQASHLVLQVPQ